MPHIRKTASAVLLAMYGVTGPASAADLATEDLATDLGLPERLDRTLRDLMDDVEPTLEGALDYMRSLGAINDPLNYRMPEVLPNGDIIIRRRADAPALDPDAPPGPGEDPPADLPPDRQPDPEDGVRI